LGVAAGDPTRCSKRERTPKKLAPSHLAHGPPLSTSLPEVYAPNVPFGSKAAIQADRKERSHFVTPLAFGNRFDACFGYVRGWRALQVNELQLLPLTL
jgi:hypothetical protein